MDEQATPKPEDTAEAATQQQDGLLDMFASAAMEALILSAAMRKEPKPNPVGAARDASNYAKALYQELYGEN